MDEDEVSMAILTRGAERVGQGEKKQGKANPSPVVLKMGQWHGDQLIAVGNGEIDDVSRIVRGYSSHGSVGGSRHQLVMTDQIVNYKTSRGGRCSHPVCPLRADLSPARLQAGISECSADV